MNSRNEGGGAMKKKGMVGGLFSAKKGGGGVVNWGERSVEGMPSRAKGQMRGRREPLGEKSLVDRRRKNVLRGKKTAFTIGSHYPARKRRIDIEPLFQKDAFGKGGFHFAKKTSISEGIEGLVIALRKS